MDECFVTIDGDAVVEDFEMGRGCGAVSAFFVGNNDVTDTVIGNDFLGNDL